MLTVSEEAKRRGYIDFDCAIPVDFVHEAKLVTGHNPVGHVVWVYKTGDYSSNFGQPMPVSEVGEGIVSKTNKNYLNEE